MPVMTDCYIINPYVFSTGARLAAAAVVTKKADGSTVDISRPKLVTVDAKFVDGVENTAGTVDFFINNMGNKEYKFADYTITNGETVYNAPYEITVLNGLKRYTTSANMTADVAKNDFTSWAGDIWEVVNGIPTFKSTLSGTYGLTINGAGFDQEQVQETEVDDELVFDVNYEGSAIAGKPVIVPTAGSEYVTISGNVVTATAESGENVVTLKITYSGKEWSVNLKVLPNIVPTDYEKELLFSAESGEFFDEDKTVVTFDEIFGEDVTVTRAYDADGNKLTVDGEKVLGLGLGAIDSAVKTSVTIYTSDRAVKINVDAVTLAINEFADMDYFTAKQTATVSGNKVTFADGDFEHDGYYILLNDIDAENATFTSTATSLTSITAARIDDNGAGLTDSEGNFVKGFSGVLDGNGYSFKNFKISGNNGIFPLIVDDAVIKNVGFINCVSKTRNSIAVSLAGNATMQDVYVEASGLSNVYMSHTVTVGSVGANATMKNVMINVSYADSATYPMGLNTDNRTYAQTAEIINAPDANLSDVYVISNVALARAMSANKKTDGTNFDTPLKEWYDSKDAALVDGVASGVATTYQNIKRYTSATKMTADKAINDFTSWNADIWEIVNGIPAFKKALSKNAILMMNGMQVSTDAVVEVAVNEPLTFTTTDAQASFAGKPAIEVVEGDAYVTVSNNQVTVTSVNGENVITLALSYGDKSWTVSLSGIVYDTYEKELQFSAYDGLFFDGADVVDVDTILGEGVTASSITDGAGNTLTYDTETGALTGMDLGATNDYVNQSVNFRVTDKIVKVNVKAATLIIDEASDFEYFSLKKTAGVAGGDNTAYVAPGDMEFDGYYILAKDINFEQEEYAHDFYNGEVVSWSARGFDTCLTYIGTTHGLTGTFDGNGHTITDITFANTVASGNSKEAGLFGWLNGGTIKNTAFVSPDEGDLNGGSLFGYASINSSKFEDCYFYLDTSYGNYGTGQFVKTKGEDITFTRCYIEIASTNVTYNSAGSFYGGVPTMNDSYLVFSHSPFLGSGAATTAQVDAESEATSIGTRKPVLADAAYVDGVANVATSDRFYVATRWDSAYYSLANYTIVHGTTTYEKGSTYGITLIGGLQRYTSKAKMAEVDNDFTNWSNNLWTIVEGVPTWKATIA